MSHEIFEAASLLTNQSKEVREEYSKYHVALSPDGQSVASFNTENNELKFYKLKSLDSPLLIDCKELAKSNLPSATPFWSLAISNTINDDVLIAVSCFNNEDIMSEPPDGINSKNASQVAPQDIDPEKGADFITKVPSATFVISTKDNSRIQTTIDNIGGVLHFLDNVESNGFSDLILMNCSGISKVKIYYKDNSKSISLLFSPMEEFEFPSIVEFKILKLYHDTSCKSFLKSSIERNYFFAEDYKTHKIEMYNLRTYELEMVFYKREESITSEIESANFTISKNERLLARHGDKSITIYLMENGLEVMTETFYTNKILSISFIDNDEKLFIIAEEGNGYHESGKIKFVPVIFIWDLFTYKSSLRKIENLEIEFSTLQGNASHLIASSSGSIISITEDGLVFSIPDHPKIEPSVVLRELLNLPIQDIKDSGKFKYYHTIFQSDKVWMDAKAERKRSIVVNNKEPWVHYKKYQRVSAYLDEKKSIQLIIGETTVQVWRKKDHGSKRVLEYIWISPGNGNQRIQIDSLSIGNFEFSLDLKITSQHTSNLSKFNIHWPQNTHTLKDACEALKFLYSRRNEPVGPKNQNKFESLVYDTEKLVFNVIKNHPNVWRLSEIRYDLMADLIQGHRAPLIKRILFENTPLSDTVHSDPASRVCRFLHVPRLYDWENSEDSIKKSDLQIAIECSEGGHRKDSVIVEMLLDYYSNNAMQNTGWMFTVSKAIPLLTGNHLESYIKELFYKPCFGAKEEHLDPVFINQKELKKRNNRSIYALNVKQGLIRKKKKKSWWKKAKSIHRFKRNKDGKPESLPVTNLRVVPLPDFTVYPEGINDQKVSKWRIPLLLLKTIVKPRTYTVQEDHQRSSFLRFIRQDENEAFYDNPAMEACINFKWESARNHFIRHIILYIIYALSFSLLAGVFSFASFSPVFYLIFYYLGYHLLSKEIIQLNYEGWNYFTVYHIIDLLACVVPLASLTIFYSLARITSRMAESDPTFGPDPMEFKKVKTITNAFVILLIWFELIVLLRFFEKSAHYINMIVNILYGVAPFIVFMGIVIIGFGHSMHFLLKNPGEIGLTPQGSTFEIKPEDPNSPNQFSGYLINEVYDVNSTSDNYYRKFTPSVVAVYFWMLGRWDQLEIWNSWPITLLSMAGGILLVIIMQNMLIAFMTGVFDETKSNVKQVVLKFRADLIADYEAIERLFGNTKNPRYIYYIGSSEDQEKWLGKAEKYRKAYKSSLIDDVKFDDDDYDDDYANETDYKGGSNGGNKDGLLNVKGFKGFKDVSGSKTNESKEKQRFELKLEHASDEDVEDINNKQIRNKINNLEEKIDKLTDDVTNRINAVEENLKEVLKLLKEGK